MLFGHLQLKFILSLTIGLLSQLLVKFSRNLHRSNVNCWRVFVLALLTGLHLFRHGDPKFARDIQRVTCEKTNVILSVCSIIFWIKKLHTDVFFETEQSFAKFAVWFNVLVQNMVIPSCSLPACLLTSFQCKLHQGTNTSKAMVHLFIVFQNPEACAMACKSTWTKYWLKSVQCVIPSRCNSWKGVYYYYVDIYANNKAQGVQSMLSMTQDASRVE